MATVDRISYEHDHGSPPIPVTSTQGHDNMPSKKQVTFGQGTIVLFDEVEEYVTERLRKTSISDNVDDTPPIAPEDTYHLCSEYNENEQPGSRVRFCQIGSQPGELHNATDVGIMGNGDLVVTDMICNKLKLFTSNGVVGTVYAADEISEPWGATDIGTEKIAVTSRRTQSVVIMCKTWGNVVRRFGHGFFKSPCGITTVGDNAVIVTDDVANRVSVHDVTGGKVVAYIGQQLQFKNPRYVAVSANGNIIVSDSGNHSIKVFDRNRNFVRSFGKYGRDDGCFKFPHGVCTDNRNNILVADQYNNRVSVFDELGRFSCHIVTSVHGVYHPHGVALTSDLRLCITVGDMTPNRLLIYQLERIETGTGES
ncbi:tripartite motif-containing protein 2-like [Haliotis rufescens]|uniref:tripartite motif-containing protein 2-like n=1 Tax=Haliotis rufescens TaxID=6454 RepID=UPI00201FB044|nr:tripartite motif-containing protein 2-like [Haliotis rufescens]